MRCGDPLPRAFDFDSLTAVGAERCSRLPTAAGLRALEWPFGLRPWITPRQFSATATGERDERLGGAQAGVSETSESITYKHPALINEPP